VGTETTGTVTVGLLDGIVGEEVVIVIVEQRPKSAHGSQGNLVQVQFPVAAQSGRQLFSSKHVTGQVPSV
jgi:hypothetical protein